MKLPTFQKFIRAVTLPVLGLILLVPVRADLNSDLAFSAFSNVDLNSLAAGNVLQARGGLISFQRGITSQSLYIIDAAPSEVQGKLVHWNPASHPELKVWVHKALPAQSTAADFADLSNLPDNSSVQYLIDATAKFDPDKLQASSSEAQLIAAAAAQEKDPKALFAHAWGQILAGRINSFLSGHGDSDTVKTSGGDIRPMSDIKSLFHADPKIYGQFQRLFNQTPVKAVPSSPVATVPPVRLYYDCFDIEGSGSLGTGAIYQGVVGPSIQSVDIEFYVNSGIYAEIELEQLWPVTVNGKTETLVWRDDMVSAPTIAYYHGVDRLAAGMLMLQETKQGIDAFRAEFK